uniref:Ubiquinol-cytochrome-c reductase complex assembly factor 3 n=1 Tax=Rhabditophanes sp. KR3021 TaxID=114890 RepID=A0AC35UDM6_9BILA
MNLYISKVRAYLLVSKVSLETTSMLQHISSPKMGLIAKALVFGAGAYTGIYLSQNYEIPLLPSPSELEAKLTGLLKDSTPLKEFLPDLKKKDEARKD